MVGLSDANIFGWGNTLKFTNFQPQRLLIRRQISSNTKSPTPGKFYTADFSAGRDSTTRRLNMGLRKGVHTSGRTMKSALAYSDVKSKRFMIDLDTSLLIKVRKSGRMGRQSRAISLINSNIC